MKKFTTAEIRDLFNQVMNEEISFSEMVEVINERVEEPRLKEGDFVKKVLSGAICIYHDTSDNGCMVSHAGSNNGYTTTKTGTGWGYTKEFRPATEAEKQELLDALAKEGKRWNAEKLCVEDIPEELKKGDLAIFWDNEKKIAVIKSYDRSIGSEEDYFLHKDQNGFRWANAIKFESKEQYERFLKGEI